MQWYDTNRGRQRLQSEMELLAIDFPQMKFGLLEDDTAFVAGYIGPSDKLRKSYYVVAAYPYGYPNGNRIKVYVPHIDFCSDVPHLYGEDQELCLEHNDFNHDDTICTVIGWVIQWLILYENFLQTGETW
ncbi:MAG: hypothetical protein P9L98_01590 [Candidatus Kaelpia imicola]|nr:hypothetical protein [Candidatus Kaelpia imicola]